MIDHRTTPSRPTVVLAHDHLTEMGGAERVVAVLLEHHPRAPLLTSAVRPDGLDPAFAGHPIHRSCLDRAAADKRRARVLFPILPLAFRRMSVPRADLLLTSSSAFAHHLRPPEGMPQVWYCHTPPRFLWDQDAYFRGRPGLRVSLTPMLAMLRRLDRAAAGRIDLVVANSRHTAGRIREVYGRDAPVIWPPVPVDRFRPTAERSGRFLVLSRLLAYKRIEVAIEAAGLAGVDLDIVGEGPDRRRLERLAGPRVRFLGRLSDPDARALLARCSALLVPGREDLGLAVVEAQASGRPPIVLAAGGALETVEDGVTGFHVTAADAAAFAVAIERSQREPLSTEALVAAARRLDTPVFLARLDAVLERLLLERRSAPGAVASIAGRT